MCAAIYLISTDYSNAKGPIDYCNDLSNAKETAESNQQQNNKTTDVSQLPNDQYQPGNDN